MKSDLDRERIELVERIHDYDAHEALKILVMMGEPVTRWTLEAIAIASPDDVAEQARALKPNPVRSST